MTVVLEPNNAPGELRARCDRCGEVLSARLPLRISSFVAVCDAFEQAHEACSGEYAAPEEFEKRLLDELGLDVEQRKRHTQLMLMPRSQWPDALRARFAAAEMDVDSVAQVIASYISAGER